METDMQHRYLQPVLARSDHQHFLTHKFTWIQKTKHMKLIFDYTAIRQNTKLQLNNVSAQKNNTNI